MKIGLIARPEADRGLGIQSHGFFENIPVDRVCLINMPASHRHQQFTYAGVPVMRINYDVNRPCLDENVMREWMRGLDVVFSVETPYDWQFPHWARAEGVKTVIQGNPEFTRHGLLGYEHLASPDARWCQQFGSIARTRRSRRSCPVPRSAPSTRWPSCAVIPTSLTGRFA